MELDSVALRGMAVAVKARTPAVIAAAVSVYIFVVVGVDGRVLINSRVLYSKKCVGTET